MAYQSHRRLIERPIKIISVARVHKKTLIGGNRCFSLIWMGFKPIIMFAYAFNRIIWEVKNSRIYQLSNLSKGFNYKQVKI